RSFFVELWHDKAAAIGLIVIALIVLAAIFAPWLAPHDPAAQALTARMRPPVWLPRGTWDHILGTDNLGRDVLSRVIWGGRVTLIIGVLTCLIAATIGTVVGLWAGYAGGRTDSVLMRLVDIQVSFPGILL